MVKKPLLIFPRPTVEAKVRKYGAESNLHFPEQSVQVNRLNTIVTSIERTFANQTAYLGNNPANFVSEMVLVLEVAGFLDDFFKAVKKTPGMEFLAEYQIEFDPDANFYNVDKHGVRQDKALGARLFLTMTNQQSIRELLGYWNEYKKPIAQQNFRFGTTKFRNLFEQLKDIRPYSVSDRLKDTGMEDYLEELRQFGLTEVNFEIELAYKSTNQKNEAAYVEIVQLVNTAGGQVIGPSRTNIPSINYHALIAKAPISAFEDLTENTNVSFIKSQQVLFFRPVGQSISKASDIDDRINEPIDLPEIDVSGEPVVALLDGLPLQNHALLRGRILVDDPDNYEENYLAERRFHGTTMASLIINGDLNQPDQQPLSRPIYVRPIMKPEANSLNDAEFLPDDRLPIDIIHRSVLRMFESSNGNAPVASGVKIINLSIGDSYRPFHANISTWAKLIDWLSYKYNILFIISAGNKRDHLELNISEQQFDLSTSDAIQNLVLQDIIAGNYDRKILTPAESVNSLTVGSSHHDYSPTFNAPQRRDVFSYNHLLSPISRIGFGYNQSVKPEILMPGGKKLYRKALLQTTPDKTLLRIEDNFPSSPPGNLVAMPGRDGNVSYRGYSCGTSNSTALTTRLAAQLYEMLLDLNSELEAEKRIDEKYFTVILKSLLAHGASWGDAQTILSSLVRQVPGIAATTIKRHMLPYIGYGYVNTDRILYCTDQRVTLIGFGELSKEEGKNAHLYSFPLPPSIGLQRIDKRLVITLAWFSPLNFNTSKYRKAQLFFNNLQHNEHIAINRGMYDYDAAQKGTLQHDVLIGDKADAFNDGDMLQVQVNCREDASGLEKNEMIKYGLCVTMEVLENVETRIYEEVQLRLRERVLPRP